jgi:hypothetical protein
LIDIDFVVESSIVSTMPSVQGSEKSGMEKINESMEKIGAMLGVQPSNSGSDDKKEALIKKEEPTVTANNGPTKSTGHDVPLEIVNSAEGHVIGPPTTRERKDAPSYNTMATKPTEPGKTKTAAGAAIATIAARVDNVANVFNKSMRKMSQAAGCGEDIEEQKTKVLADGSTISTEYVTPGKAPKRPIPYWLKNIGYASVLALIILGICAAVPGNAIHSYLRDTHADHVASRDNEMTLAFIGNSYMYINDLPRVMEQLSHHNIKQQSVINTGAGLGSLLKQGNGMYELWQTTNALDFWGGFDFVELMSNTDIEIDEDYQLYDFGMCTVPQLLEGYDGYLSYKNNNEVYFDVGTNPCFEDEYYMTIIQQQSFQDPMYFDYVILNDQTRRMANEDAREDSIDALTQAYAPLIKASRAKPILIDTHAYYFVEDGMYGNETMGDVFLGNSIAAFTSSIYEGLYEYVDELGALLPDKQKPKIAPVGLTYLAIYEDNQKQWRMLFSDDAIHASQAGTYLAACVLYCTIYGHLPAAQHNHWDMRSIFYRSRALYGNTTATPTLNQAAYIRKWPKKVALEGYLPKSFKKPGSSKYDSNEPENMWYQEQQQNRQNYKNNGEYQQMNEDAEEGDWQNRA